MQVWLGACSFFATWIVSTLDKMAKVGFKAYLKNWLRKFLGNDN